jgi:hypothetical protein
MNRENLVKKGNESIAAGLLLSVGSVVTTCPLCILAGAAFVVNGIREKVIEWRS